VYKLSKSGRTLLRLRLWWVKEKSPSAVTAEEDIPKTDYIFISSAQCRDKVNFKPIWARRSVVVLEKKMGARTD
jgi:hypothetical protein